MLDWRIGAALAALVIVAGCRKPAESITYDSCISSAFHHIRYDDKIVDARGAIDTAAGRITVTRTAGSQVLPVVCGGHPDSQGVLQADVNDLTIAGHKVVGDEVYLVTEQAWLSPADAEAHVAAAIGPKPKEYAAGPWTAIDINQTPIAYYNAPAHCYVNQSTLAATRRMTVCGPWYGQRVAWVEGDHQRLRLAAFPVDMAKAPADAGPPDLTPPGPGS